MYIDYNFPKFMVKLVFLLGCLIPFSTQSTLIEDSSYVISWNSHANHEQDMTRPTIVLGEYEYPYFSVNYTSGTMCDLNGQPRNTTVFYVCHESTSGQIIHIAEVNSCNYHLIFATNRLCSHPAYKRPSEQINKIQCYPQNGAPSKPAKLQLLENERDNLTSKSLFDANSFFGTTGFNKIKVDRKLKDNTIIYRIRPAEDESGDDKTEKSVDPSETPVSEQDGDEDADFVGLGQAVLTDSIGESHESSSGSNHKLRDFIMQKSCLLVDEFQLCFNKFLTRTVKVGKTEKLKKTVLGAWDKDAHLNWLDKNQKELPRPSDPVPHVTYFYTDGSVCEGKEHHTTMLVLKCHRKWVNDYRLFYVQPDTCLHHITILSQYFCEPKVDEFGDLIEEGREEAKTEL